jgi:hypothetical protein
LRSSWRTPFHEIELRRSSPTAPTTTTHPSYGAFNSKMVHYHQTSGVNNGQGGAPCPAPPSRFARARAASSTAISRRLRPKAKSRRSCSPPPCMASTRISVRLLTSSPRTAISQPRPTCSGGRCRGRSRTRIAARPSARSRGPRKSGRAKPTWRTRSRMCAACRSSTAALRRWDSATAAVRDPRPQAPRLRRRHRLPRHAAAGLHPGARRRHGADLYHLGRPGPRRAR